MAGGGIDRTRALLLHGDDTHQEKSEWSCRTRLSLQSRADVGFPCLDSGSIGGLAFSWWPSASWLSGSPSSRCGVGLALSRRGQGLRPRRTASGRNFSRGSARIRTRFENIRPRFASAPKILRSIKPSPSFSKKRVGSPKRSPRTSGLSIFSQTLKSGPSSNHG